MKFLTIAILSAGIAVVGTPAVFAQDMMVDDTMTTNMPIDASLSDIGNARSATFVEYDEIVGLPGMDVAYVTNELRQWLDTNPSLADDFESVNYTATDVDAVAWDGTTLKLFVKSNAADQREGIES